MLHRNKPVIVIDESEIVKTNNADGDTSLMNIIDSINDIERRYTDESVVRSPMNKSETCCAQHKLYLHTWRQS